MRIKIYFIVLLISFNLLGQEDPILLSLKSNLDKFSKNHAPQKVFIDFDQDYYLSGETMNFAVFLAKENGKILKEEEVVYLDFLTKDAQLNTSIKVSTRDGRAFGFISIPDSLKATTIKVSAYTRWMANVDKAFYFQKEISVFNRNDRNLFECEEDTKKTNTWGSPYLVADVPNQVPFLSIKKNRNLLLVDRNGDSIFAISRGNDPEKFIPQLGELYFVKDDLGNIEKLPPVSESGIAIAFNNSNNNLDISLNSNLKPTGSFRFFVQKGNEVLYQSVYSSSERSKLFSLPKDLLKEGLLLFGIIDDEGAFISYRFYDLQKKENSLLVLGLGKDSYSPREKVSLNLSLSEKAFPMGGSFSVSVTKRTESDEVKGRLKDYLKNSVDFTANQSQSLENWRYNPLRVQEQLKKGPSYNHEYNAITIRGQVLDIDNKPIPEQSFVFFFAGQKFSYNGRTDKNGEVVFQAEPFYGTEYVAIQPLFPDIVGPVTFKQFDDISPNTSFVDCGIETVISAVSGGVVKEYENQRIRNAYFNGEWETSKTESDVDPFEKYYYREIVLDEYASFKTMEEVIIELLSTVRIMGKNKKLRVYDHERTISYRGTPNFLIDGRPVTDPEEIFKLDPATIRSIGVINTITDLREFYVFGKNGVIVFNSIDEKLNRPKELSKNIFIAQGFTPFSNDMVEKITPESKPDFRSSIYWNPVCVINKESGALKLEFDTSDDLGEYVIRISGITETGNMIEKTKSFSVSK